MIPTLALPASVAPKAPRSVQSDFYTDTRWCPRCRGYLPYLQSPAHGYCASCGGRVQLFSPEDSRRLFGRRPVRRAATTPWNSGP